MIPDRTEELARLHFQHAAREEPSSNGHKPAGPSSRTDEEIIEKLRSEAGGKLESLFSGDLSGHDGDHSRADDAFVHKLWSYTQDPEQIRRIHAASGLHRPEKSGRRTDYLQMSIDRAAKNVGWFYEWSGGAVLKLNQSGRERGPESPTEAADVPPGSCSRKLPRSACGGSGELV